MQSGKRLDRKYVINRELGGGGFGKVYLADDLAVPDRPVAIKVLRETTEGAYCDLIDEMRALARFGHPNIVMFYHHFEELGRLHLVMEYCSGGSLFDLLRARGPQSEVQVFSWGLTLCETLAFVHSKGIVHHDIKPLNILLTSDDTIKIGDFGIANSMGGTISYLSPEMLQGHEVESTDPRVDVYALGVTLLELLIGQNPFRGLSAADQLEKQLAHEFIPRNHSRWVQDILFKALHPTPELRFQSATDFATAIRSKYVADVFESNRVRAEVCAKKAENSLTRRRWKLASKHSAWALHLCPDSVAGLVAAGRCELLLRRIDKAKSYFETAMSISQLAPVQKELGWIELEENRVPNAISKLSDHVKLDASDFEAFNLLLKCYFTSDRFDAGTQLANAMIMADAPNECFYSNGFLCRLLNQGYSDAVIKNLLSKEIANPFIAYNLKVATENPKSWGERRPLKAKLLFEEYRFGSARTAKLENKLQITRPEGTHLEFAQPIVTIGSHRSNDLVVVDSSVSRRHCAIVNILDDVWIYDLESTVGTRVDTQPLKGRRFLDGVHGVEVGKVNLRISAKSGLLI